MTKFRVVVTDFFAQPPEEATVLCDTLDEALALQAEALREPLTGADIEETEEG